LRARPNAKADIAICALKVRNWDSFDITIDAEGNDSIIVNQFRYVIKVDIGIIGLSAA